MRAFLPILVIAFVACSKGESSSELAQVAKETLTSVRAREVVKVQVRLDKPEPPSSAELEIRKQIEEQIEQQHVGAIVQTTTDLGHYDLTIEVESTADAVPRVRTILRDAGVLERATVRVETKK